MRIIELEALENGAHNNLFFDGHMDIPEGWVEIPSGMTIPESYPFVDIVLNKQGKVIELTPKEVPESTYVPVPTEEEKLRADVDYLSVMTGVELS